MRVYLAGPDVFRPDAQVWAEEARAICAAAGCEALLPLDGDARTAPAIYAQNLALIRRADAVLANLNAFRGAEPDSGTCFEIGFAVALGKPVVAYVAEMVSAAERVQRWQGEALRRVAAGRIDLAGSLVEEFDLPLNLMLAVPARIVRGGLSEAARALCGEIGRSGCGPGRLTD